MAPPGDPRPVTPVGILAAELADVYGRLAAADVDAEITERLRAAWTLAAGLDAYVAGATTKESPALAALAAHTAATDWTALGDEDAEGATPVLEQEMLSGHVEGQALRMLVHATGARRVLEVGMFTGYSALAMAEALPPEGSIVALERDPRVAALAREWLDASEAGARVAVEVGDARATLDRLAESGEAFDLVFVDADKGGYLQYVEIVLTTSLLAPGGLIAVDNTLMQGEPWRRGAGTASGEAIAAFNEALAADPRVEQVLLPLRDGLTLIRRA